MSETPATDTGPENEPTAAVPSDAAQDAAHDTTHDAAGADVPPDHLAIDPASPFFDGDKLGRGVGIRFKGVERNNIEEYCISEGWVRVQAGKTMDRKGRPLTLKLSGPVEAWYQDLGDNPPVARRT